MAIILIGEIRDKETAHAGIEASLTGHLVLSNLHTNSAPEIIPRLLDLGLDPVSFSDACVYALAQRLIRTICKNCKEEYQALQTEIEFIKRQYGPNLAIETIFKEPLTLCRGKGCDECGGTGYKGLTGVHKLLSSTPELRALVYKEAAVSEIAAQAAKDDMRPCCRMLVTKFSKAIQMLLRFRS